MMKARKSPEEEFIPSVTSQSPPCRCVLARSHWHDVAGVTNMAALMAK